jgi:hypothetical protein
MMSLRKENNEDNALNSIVGSSGSFPCVLGIQPYGIIVAAGVDYNGSSYDFVVVRYLPK